MAKFLVVDSEHGTEIPFLRGILIGSLQDAGLAFDEAHRLASDVRDNLSESNSVSTRKLRAAVLKRLRGTGNRSVLERYRAGKAGTLHIEVEYENGVHAPFSRGYHQRRLESCAISTDEAIALTQTIYKHMLDQGKTSVRAHHVEGIAHGCLEH